MAHRAADTVILGGRITTMRTDNINDAEALAINGDRISAVGTTAEITELVDDQTLVLDVDGRTVIPGLIDAHVHFARAGFTWNNEVRWGTVTSLQQGLDLIAERARNIPKGEWITVIGGWHPFQFRENRHPTIEDLDRVAPDHPVFVQFLYTYGMLNSVGRSRVPLERAIDEGVDPATMDFDGTGSPTGIVRTLPSLKWLYSQLPAPTFEDQVQSTIAAGHEFARFGITGVIDGGGANTGADVYGPIFETWRRGELTPRVRLTMHASGPGEEETEVGGYLRFIPPRVGDERLSVLGVGEIVMWPFHDNLNRPPQSTPENIDRLETLLRQCAESRSTVQMHLIHPETTDLVVDMWDRIHQKTPIDDLRWAIVHGESLTSEHCERLASMGVGVIGEAVLRMGGDQYVEDWGAERFEYAPNLRELRAAGVKVAVGSDGLRAATYNPFATLQWLTTGQSLTGLQVWSQDNVLDRLSALSLMTREAGWFSFEEAERGVLEPGRLADVSVLSDDYFDVPEAELPDLRSDLTMVGGDVVWSDLPE